MSKISSGTEGREKPWRGIVKVQRSIVTTHDKPQIVIYNKSRSILYQQDMTRSLSRLFGEEFKIYMHAELKKTKLHLMYRTEPQRW